MFLLRFTPNFIMYLLTMHISILLMRVRGLCLGPSYLATITDLLWWYGYETLKTCDGIRLFTHDSLFNYPNFYSPAFNRFSHTVCYFNPRVVTHYLCQTIELTESYRGVFSSFLWEKMLFMSQFVIAVLFVLYPTIKTLFDIILIL